MCSVVEEAKAGVHQSDSQLAAGVDDHLVGGGAWRRGDVLNAALKHVDRNFEYVDRNFEYFQRVREYASTSESTICNKASHTDLLDTVYLASFLAIYTSKAKNRPKT